jgi:sugar/nucleoside kinase (ribokinase family)
MAGVIGIGNALTDIMTMLPNDSVITKLKYPKGSMQLVDKTASQKVLDEIKSIKKSITSGGSAANTIHGLAKMGIRTGFIGKIGHDEFGNFFSEDLLKSNINPVLLKSQTDSGRAIALVSPDSERTFATYLGAAVELTSKDIKPEFFAKYKYLHIEGYLLQNHELMISVAKKAKKAKLKISLDLASFNVVESNYDFLHDFVNQYVDIVFANEEEAKAYTGYGPEMAVQIIADECEIAVVKMGKDGSLIKHNRVTHNIDAIKAKSIDTTGAGDLYAAGFLYGLIENIGFKKSGKVASLLAGKVIETIGAKISDKEWKIIHDEVAKIKVN